MQAIVELKIAENKERGLVQTDLIKSLRTFLEPVSDTIKINFDNNNNIASLNVHFTSERDCKNRFKKYMEIFDQILPFLHSNQFKEIKPTQNEIKSDEAKDTIINFLRVYTNNNYVLRPFFQFISNFAPYINLKVRSEEVADGFIIFFKHRKDLDNLLKPKKYKKRLLKKFKI